MLRFLLSQPYFKPCGSRVAGSAAWERTQRIISLLLCTVKIPDILFGFANHDWACPQQSNEVPGWNRPLPGVVRYVGTDSQPSLLFPTGPYVKNTVHCAINSQSPKVSKCTCLGSNADMYCHRNGYVCAQEMSDRMK